MNHSEEKISGLIIDVARLSEDGERFTGEIPVEALEHDKDDYLFTPTSGLRYNLYVQLLGDELLVRGKIEEDFTCLCVRCAKNFQWKAIDEDVTFSIESGKNSFVDLTKELRECIIICYPSNPLCKEDCLGLCPHCGVDLNNESCSCHPSLTDEGWSKLDEFRTEK